MELVEQLARTLAAFTIAWYLFDRRRREVALVAASERRAESIARAKVAAAAALRFSPAPRPRRRVIGFRS